MLVGGSILPSAVHSYITDGVGAIVIHLHTVLGLHL